jgi:uncharacterized protein
MTERDDIVARLRAAMPDLKRRWPIRSLGVFGSFARGDEMDESDLDVLVEFERPVDLSSFLALEAMLRSLAGRRVDLVSRRALKPHIGRHVLSELLPV